MSFVKGTSRTAFLIPMHGFVQFFTFGGIYRKGGKRMELKKPVGDVDDLIFQDAWEVSQR